MLRTAFFAFFQCHLNYNILNWSCACKSNLNRVKLLLDKALKILSETNNTGEIKKHTEILDFDNLILYNYNKFMWKLFHNELPFNIKKFFVKNQTRNPLPGKNFIPIFRTNYKERFITNTAPVIWYDLPEYLRNINSYKLFSRKLHKHLTT